MGGSRSAGWVPRPGSPVNGSLKIGTLFGIPIRIHWTFLVLLYVVASLGIPWLLVLAIFGSVLLHELGHSLVARSYGIRVIDITFWPLGGMARMVEIPEVPKVEGLVAIAGPAVNFVLAGLGFAVLFGLGAFGSADPGGAVTWFIGVNLMLGTFNLVPAFPMDGGRLLRAWFARTTDWLTATEHAVAVGRVIAGIMFVGPLLLMFVTRSLCLLPLIAAFVWVAGGRELMAVRLRHGVSPFGRARVGVPVPAQAEWERAPAATETDDSGGARRPATWEQDPAPGSFTEESVRQLERFRGRLRRPSDER